MFCSRGSVIPRFKALLKTGSKSLPITDERMTRFWITIDQGVKFVNSCLNDMVGGEIFVPKIPSMSILDAARFLAPNARVDVIGIRPGEKLHETMISIDDARDTVELGDKFVILPPEIEPYGDRSKYVKGKPVQRTLFTQVIQTIIG